MADRRSLREEVSRIANALPAGAEIQRVLLNLDDPANDRASKDRYIVLVAGNAVHHSLIGAMTAQAGFSTPNPDIKFAAATQSARARGLVSDLEAETIDWIREVRNAFAHASAPLSFDEPFIQAMVENIHCHPVSDWASYFSPVFPAREQYALACGEFCRMLLSNEHAHQTVGDEPEETQAPQ